MNWRQKNKFKLSRQIQIRFFLINKFAESINFSNNPLSSVIDQLLLNYTPFYNSIQIMIGPYYQRLAQAQRHITGKQMLERIQAHSQNPLTMVIDKLKKQFSEYETAYNEDIINHQITSVDKLLSYDGKLGPILANLQKQNNLLRRELSLFESQLSNSVSICEQVIAENNQLKEALLQKNQDITKIIQTIARNQSQSRNQLEDKIALLEQENSILIQHLEEIKKKHEEYRRIFESKEDEVKRWERKWTETKKHLAQTIDREREVTRKLAISQHTLFQQKEKFEIMSSKFYNSEIEKSNLQSELAKLEGNRDNFDPAAMRRTIQNQYIQVIQEHRALKNERQDILKQLQKNKAEKQKLKDAMNDIENKFNKVVNEYELTNNILNEQKTKNQTLISTLKKLEMKIDEIKNENVQLKMEVQSGKSVTFAKQKSLYSQIDELRRQLDEKSSQSAKILREMQTKNQMLLDVKDSEIKRLNEENTEYRRLVDRRS